MIDRIRHDIQQRLEQSCRGRQATSRARRARSPRALNAQTENDVAADRGAGCDELYTLPSTRRRAPEHALPARRTAASASTRTAPGETKARVLAALSSEHALTAGEVAKTTGLARGTVSTTLSKLSKTGEVVKADRGYRLPTTNGAAANAAGPADTPATADA